MQLHDRPFLSLQEDGVVCIDENGMEIFSLPEVNKHEVSNFYNGIALIDSQYIINKEGEFLHDLKNEFNLEIIMLPDNYFDGFIFVRKEMHDVTMTGVMNSSLEWLIEPTSKLGNIEAKANFLYYCGEMGYYDALYNEFIDEAEFEYRHVRRAIPESGMIFLEKEYGGAFSYACPYTEEKGTIGLPDFCETGFYNENLEIVLNLSQYDSVKPLTDFRNGKCLITFRAAKDKTYTGVINTSGQFIFLQEGYVHDYDNERIEFTDCYYDWDGTCYVND